MTEWTTYLEGTPDNLIVHVVMFVPTNWTGKGNCVALGLPECELITTHLDRNGEPFSIVNRPKLNLDNDKWLRQACRYAVEFKAMLVINCDTREQADWAAAKTTELLHGFERLPLERFYEPISRKPKRDLE